MVNSFRKPFRRSPRRALRLHREFIAAIFSGLATATFFLLTWIGPGPFDWNNNPLIWILGIGATMIAVGGLFLFGYYIAIKDEEERSRFSDSYCVGIMASIFVSLLIIFKNVITSSVLAWVATLILITIVALVAFYFILKPK